MNKTKQNKSITNKTYIFSFLDILGYKDIVNSYADDEQAILKLEEFIEFSVFQMYKDFCNVRTGIKGDKETATILRKIKISLISDSILIRMPIDIGIDEKSKKNSVVEIGVFMYFVSFLILTFITNIGLFLRAGIAIGQHYEKIKKNNAFIFSKSLIMAYQLELRAKTIRVLVDSTVINFMAENNSEFTLEQYQGDFYKDSDGEFCLDYYDILKSDEMKNRFLTRVLDVAGINVTRNKEISTVISKYEAFEKYHNEKVINKFKLPQYKMTLSENSLN